MLPPTPTRAHRPTARAVPAEARLDLTLCAALFVGVLISLLGCLLLLARLHAERDGPPAGPSATPLRAAVPASQPPG